VALAGPYANHLHFASVSTSSLNYLQARCSSWWDNNVKAQKATDI